jgi:hypothetical protein
VLDGAVAAVPTVAEVAGAGCGPGATSDSGGGAAPSARGAEPVPAGGAAFIQIAVYSTRAATTMSATPAKVASTLPPLLRTDRSHRHALQYGPRHDDASVLVLGCR